MNMPTTNDSTRRTVEKLAANARLIAAAPELANALEQLLREADDDGITRDGVDRALLALAAAGRDTNHLR
jgi:hypothetical protein